WSFGPPSRRCRAWVSCGPSSADLFLPIGGVELGGVGARTRGVTVASGTDERAGEHDGGDPHEPVDDPTGDVRLAEVLAEEPRDEVELRQGDKAPVETADDHEDDGDRRELLHYAPLYL